MILAKDLIELAKKEVGEREKPKDNDVKYNNEYYGGKVHGSGFEWNTVFVWWLFKKLNASTLFCGGEKTARAVYVYNYYVSAKDFYKEPATFRAGDIIALKLSNASADIVDTIGIIESIDLEKNEVVAILGDSNKAVERKVIKFDNIIGACRPAYAVEGEENRPSEGDRIDVPVDETEPEEGVEGDAEEGEGEADEEKTESDSPFVDVVEKPILHPVIKLPDSATADLELVTIRSTLKIYSLTEEEVKLGRAYLAIRITDGLGHPATGRLNVNGYEFAFSGAIQIPEKYLVTGINTLTLYASDGNTYTAHSFVKHAHTVSPIPATQRDIIDIARSHEKDMEAHKTLESRVALLEKATEGIDLADIQLSDTGLDRLLDALGRI